MRAGAAFIVALILAGAGGVARAEAPPSKAFSEAQAAFKAGHNVEGVRLLEAAERGGDEQATVALGEIYYFGLEGVATDPRKACDQFDTVKTTQAEGAHNYAQCFYDGGGRPRDLAAARVWYQKAIDLGYGQSNCALGNMLIRGQGGAADPVKGLALCRTSAEAGDANAQADMGDHYLVGEGLAKDYVQARAWYLKAAQQGQRNAAFMLGSLWWNGDGGAKDQAEAARWWKVAYDNGRLDAAEHLAAFHYAHYMAAHPRGDLSEMDEAIGWFQAHADQATDPKAHQEALDMLALAKALRAAAAKSEH